MLLLCCGLGEGVRGPHYDCWSLQACLIPPYQWTNKKTNNKIHTYFWWWNQGVILLDEIHDISISVSPISGFIPCWVFFCSICLHCGLFIDLLAELWKYHRHGVARVCEYSVDTGMTRTGPLTFKSQLKERELYPVVCRQ